MTRPVPQIAIDFVKGAEACDLASYADSGGVWTIGYGHTGLAIVRGLTITQDQADAYLAADLAVAADRLAAVVKASAINALADHQYAALISFVFNLGVAVPIETPHRKFVFASFDRPIVPPDHPGLA